MRSGTTWSQQAYLKASNTDADDQFGVSVAVSGDTVVVGAFGEDSSATGVNGNQSDNSAADAGAMYIFLIPSPTAVPAFGVRALLLLTALVLGAGYRKITRSFPPAVAPRKGLPYDPVSDVVPDS